jgi:hypothetical protein
MEELTAMQTKPKLVWALQRQVKQKQLSLLIKLRHN